MKTSWNNISEYYSKGAVTLYCGDVVHTENFPEPFADLIPTSPPYNLDISYTSNSDSLPYEQYLTFSETWISNCFNWAKPQCRFCLNVPVQTNKNGHHALSADLTSIAQDVGWKFNSHITWNKTQISNRIARGSFMMASAPNINSPIEAIVVFYKDEWKKTGGSGISDTTSEEFISWVDGVWTIGCESRKRIGHPAPFPREIPRRLIKLFSFVGDTVLDPFAGSGTTLIEAQLNNRIGIGLELSPEYCELAKKRIVKECFPTEQEGL